MRKKISDIISGFKISYKQYILQSLLATIVILAVFSLLKMERPLITISIGATVFIIFAMPENVTASFNNVVGGHLTGFIVGYFFTLIPHTSFFLSALIYSLAIGLSFFIMVACNVEHPPASATALGVVMNGFSLKAGFVFFISIAVLLMVRRYFKRYLRCLVYKQSH